MYKVLPNLKSLGKIIVSLIVSILDLGGLGVNRSLEGKSILDSANSFSSGCCIINFLFVLTIFVIVSRDSTLIVVFISASDFLESNLIDSCLSIGLESVKGFFEIYQFVEYLIYLVIY